MKKRSDIRILTPAQMGVLGLALFACTAATDVSRPAQTSTAAPTTPRTIFNAGTQNLRAGKLRDAEALLESVLATQDERFQPAALYNLGHVRFAQGLEELKKGPAAGPATARGQAAVQAADAAIRAADDALAQNDVQKMVEAYVRGRGVRKEIKAATKAVRSAMESLGAALAKWQRASADFRGAHELNPADTDAKKNAETVDEAIAKLVDSLREMQAVAGALSAKGDELGEKLKALKGRIPAPDAPPGPAGEEDDDDDKPFGPRPGEKEGPSKEGDQMPMSFEQATWLLQGFKLGGDRRLPMTADGKPAPPKDRQRPNW